MSIVKNQQAIDSTSHNRFAIFITSIGRRFAVKAAPGGYKTYMEDNGKWVWCENLANFLVWNADLQGFDDISTLIEE
ncbi:hypothetical protein bas13_0060 [Escherichia phage LeonhardEuler]|uniref:Uncharacterized protein n=2 Tax=Tunavirus TaxID=187217 RepID=A0AAE8B385_9CAUD|nr:hypothetical protein [Pseudomonas aeruginosa]YP_009902306.1 hypothetical protein H1N97_gp78 [Shigella phage Sfin-3]QXV82497.1 hypothetical protein bas13_0060 [Escherichia phage LeonhardEuler]MDQ4166604.1 hypothetical protein [Pseudomonas aeruginosa]MDQ4209579.1 hypothetical protein [Pseudomonas aeruginosa]MDQ4334829.1 hypothetical protein [Pseudomonas aeruginosa]QGF19771.1 hypothetical protein Sfin3_0078 [Shigella phage Sfin-3]